jgi:hypothetical protein
MVRIRKSRVSSVEPVMTEKRRAKAERRREFLARTEGKVWDEETQQWLTRDEYWLMAGDSVIAENEYWDNLIDEESE